MIDIKQKQMNDICAARARKSYIPFINAIKCALPSVERGFLFRVWDFVRRVPYDEQLVWVDLADVYKFMPNQLLPIKKWDVNEEDLHWLISRKLKRKYEELLFKHFRVLSPNEQNYLSPAMMLLGANAILGASRSMQNKRRERKNGREINDQ